jgi:hypothetical protein
MINLQYYKYLSHLYIHCIINYTTFNILNLVDSCAEHRKRHKALVLVDIYTSNFTLCDFNK